MTKNVKRVIVIFVVLSIFLTISLFLSAYAFKPTVTLDYTYPNFDWNFDGKSVTTPISKTEISNVIRFSHYEPPVPSRTGYTFAGWYRDIGYTVAWINGRDIVTKDITLYAKWIKNT
jgi:uncharacterized repeat protein (TIGR02543 family)